MILEVHERLALLQLLPTEGDYAALKTIRRAKEMLSFTPDEIKFYELHTAASEDGKQRTEWNTQKAQQASKDCPVDEYTTNVIRTKLSQLNDKGKLTEEFMSVFEKFVVMYR